MISLLAGRSVTPRERRVIAAAVAAVVLGVLLGRGGPARREWLDRETNRATALRDSLTMMRRLIADDQTAADSVFASRRRLARASASVIAAPTRDVAEARLIGILADVSADVGLDVSSLQAMNEALLEPRSRKAAKSRLEAVTVRGNAVGSIDAVLDFLIAVDTSSRPLSLRSLALTQARSGRPDTDADALQFEFVVSGLASTPPRVVQSARR
jgi:hypothetical protein